MASERSSGPFRLHLAGGAGLDDQQTQTPPQAPPSPRSKFAVIAFLGAVAVSALWSGGAGGYLMGLFGTHGLASISLQQWAIFSIVTFVPPLLFLALAWAIIRGQAMGEAASAFAEAADKIFSADETASNTAMRIGRAVRRELDALNAGLDTAFSRMRMLEGQVSAQISALDDATSQLQARGEAISGQLNDGRNALTESAEALTAAAADAGQSVSGQLKIARNDIDDTTRALRISAAEAADTLTSRLINTRSAFDEIAAALNASASQAGDTVAGRVAQLKTIIEAADNVLSNAAGRLDKETSSFREATQHAAQMPREVAAALDEQVKRIEDVSEAALSRAEFVLGKQESHRAAMNDMLSQLKADSVALEGKMAGERQAMEKILTTLDSESKRFQALAGESERRIDAIMAAAATRTHELAQTFAREARGLKQSGEDAGKTLNAMIAEMQEASEMARNLIGDAADDARNQAGNLVSDAAGECDRLLDTAQSLAEQTKALQGALARSVDDVQKHIALLPDIAREEAQKVREMVQQETEDMLDHSARTMATLHARGGQRSTLNLDRPLPPEESLSLGRLKRRIAPGAMTGEPDLRDARAAMQMQRKPTRPAAATRSSAPKPRSWEMRTLLDAVDGAPEPQRPSAAAAMQKLESVLSDMAVDLDAIAGDRGPQLKEWRRYLDGDRGVFARKLAAAIDGETVHRIAMLYREDPAFRDSADAYMEEFEALLSEVRDGAQGSMLASTMLSADTGKIYLAVSYALGRL